MITIRELREEDIKPLINMVLTEFIPEAPFCRFLVNWQRKPERICWNIMGNPRRLCALAFDGEQLVGVHIAEVHEFYFSLDIIAHEYLFFVREKYRDLEASSKLMRYYIEWANKHKVLLIHAGVSSGLKPNKAKRFFEAFDFTHTGYSFTMKGDSFVDSQIKTFR